jgi:hypothetical protein
LLLSPSDVEKANEPALKNYSWTPCTRKNFIAEALAWRNDSSTHRDSVTFFYFAGRGVQRMKSDAVLLLENC